MIELSGVCRSYATPDGPLHALRDVDLRVEPGNLVVLIGPSGSGKTTLLNLIGGLDTPTTGRISVLGQDLRTASAAGRASLRRRIGFIFQSFALLPAATAYENVEIGLRIAGNLPRDSWDAQVRRSLDAVGLTPWLHHRPYELSGGQQQRVAVARALAIRPQLILADEPTGDLDEESGRHLLALLGALVAHCGATIVISTHDPQALVVATAACRLVAGRLTPVP